MNKPKFTLIIPFLNEKEEVINTVKSIREHSNSNEIEIMLINDASDDGFDYAGVAEKYAAIYIVNRERTGVAASRDLGVGRSTTPYVMFLDAHMRFYNDAWIGRISGELEKDERALLCCQTRGLMHIDGEITEIKGRPVSYGACVNLYDEIGILECNWIFKEDNDTKNAQTIPIPIVLGAAYACTKAYWLHLKGLSGLKYYGNDETYISAKVWMEGGTCKLLKDIAVAHIYRSNPPYAIENPSRLYNRMLIAELLLNGNDRARVFSYITRYSFCNEAIRLLYNNSELLCSLKKHYRSVLKHDFSYFKAFNNRFYTPENSITDKDTLLNSIALHIILHCNLSLNDGIMGGRLGIALFLFHYSRYSGNTVFSEFADMIVNDIVNKVSNSTPPDFSHGLTGIGWGIEYLHQNHFIQGDTNLILEEFDKKIAGINLAGPDSTSRISLLRGIVHYILSRLYTIENKNKSNPFDNGYLALLYNHVKEVLDNNADCDEPDIFFRYCMYYEKLSTIHQPSVYDLICLNIPEDFSYEKFAFGLEGSAGVGLKLILDN